MHSVVGSLIPHDEGAVGICIQKDAAKYKCYANQGDYSNVPWTFGNTPNDPRRLIEANRDDLALVNIDNYISWALRRFDDLQWGLCDGPRSPFPGSFQIPDNL